MKKVCIYLLLLFLSSCTLEPEDYSSLDLSVGRGSVDGAVITVDSGLGAIHRLAPGYIELWLQSPVQTVTLDLTNAVIEDWQLVMKNAVSGMSLLNPGSVNSYTESQNVTIYTIDVNITSGSSHSLEFSNADYLAGDTYSFALLSDIQDKIDSVEDIYTRMNSDSSLRFVVSTGDLTVSGRRSEIDKFQQKLSLLNIPFFTTAGNHDFFDNRHEYWRFRFGRTSFIFIYKDVTFIFADSSSASIEVRVYDWFEAWLNMNRNKIQFFITHYPAIDPVGTRNGSFSSKNEAYKLLALLLDGKVDAILNGHIHSYYHFDSAGIDTYISGGGGAIPEIYDNVGRHYLKITVTGSTNTFTANRIDINNN